MNPTAARYSHVRFSQIPDRTCPCGTTRRAFVDEPGSPASMHVVRISAEAQTHYHKYMTEIYYILEGTGYLELDDQRVPVQPGDAVMIRPYCRHRAVGQLTVLNCVIPPMDESDEYVV